MDVSDVSVECQAIVYNGSKILEVVVLLLWMEVGGGRLKMV